MDLIQRTSSASTGAHAYEHDARSHARTCARTADSLMLIAAMSLMMSQCIAEVSVNVTLSVDAGLSHSSCARAARVLELRVGSSGGI